MISRVLWIAAALAAAGPVPDEEDRGVTYTGAWTRWTGGGPRWGRLFYATEAGARAAATIEGTQAVLVHKAGPDCGIARIFIDGKPAAPPELDTYSATVEWNRATVVARGLVPGRHQVAVEVTGRRNSAASHPYVQVVHITDRPPSPPPTPWPPDKAWAWHRATPWLAGFNYVPSTACNTTEWWQEGTFDPATIDRELGWAAGLGFNTTRAFIQYLVWKHDPEGLLKRLDQFLQIAAKHGISVMPVLFDDCAFGHPAQVDPVLGKQRDPIPGMILPSWTPSPGKKLGLDPEERPSLKRYVQEVIRRFKDDKRVVLWDLYNEPQNTANAGSSEFLAEIFAWAREADPSQPLSIGTWGGHAEVNHASATLCDVTTFHFYGNREGLQKRIDGLKAIGRPIACTEWFARPTGSRIEADLTLLREEKVGGYMWGLVNGRTQCQFPWWNKPGGGVDPKHGWFHDLLHPDGKPYRDEEVEALKRVLKEKPSNP
jgi:hypothetical protein